MHNYMGKLKKHWDYGLGRTALAAICAHSVSISIGICQGYSAILIPQLMSTNSMELNVEQTSWLASFGAITNPIGSILSGLLAEWIGRKKSMQASSIPFLLGWLCIGFATDINWLYAGRLITGVAAGMATASYTYVTEISTPKTRGIFQALGPVSASFGILLTYSLGYFFTWKVLAFASTLFGICTMVTIQLLPESPSYLHQKNKQDECLESLIWFRRSFAVAQDEYTKLEDAKKSNEEHTSFSHYFKLSTIKPFLILVTLFLLQELSGIYSILFYAVNFFKDANINVDEYLSSIVVGLIRFIMSIFGAILINRFGRKSLCFTSSLGMSLSMFAIVAYLKYFEITQETPSITIVPLICVVSNVFFSMIGMLPIPWILVGELFSSKVRSIMSGVVICIAQIFIFLSVKYYPIMIEHLKFSGTCSTFFIASLLAVVFSKAILPETKNKSLEEIEEKFKKTKSFGAVNKAFEASNDNIKQSPGLNGVFTIKVV